MTMRDLIPWSRPENRMPALYGDEQSSPFYRLRHEIDRLFDGFFSAPLAGGSWSPAMNWPSLEVQDKDDEVSIVAELPGMSEKDVELSVQDGMLTIRGERRSESQDRDRGWSERHYGRFERRLMLPDGADEAKCEANFRDGMLIIRMPKSREAARSRRIPINVGTRH